MRHLLRAHRVSVAWLHERLGQCKGRDPVIMFYENTANMSADIYTKSFKEAPAWHHALKLINIFAPNDLKPKNLEEWIKTRRELGNDPPRDGEVNTAWSKQGLKRQKLEDVQKRQHPGGGGGHTKSKSKAAKASR